jgi:hypothetical protein
VISLAVSPASVVEDGTTNLIYIFSRTGPNTSALTVNYAISGTADASDYTGATPGSGINITFAAGSSTALLTIDPTADTTIEADETVALTLAAGTGYTVGTTTAVTVTITNDDVPVITLAVTPAVVTEDGTANLVYTFTCTGSTTNAFNLPVDIGGTAAPFFLTGGDYALTGHVSGVTGTTATVTFPAGSATATVIANPSADTNVEADETVVLTLPPRPTYTVGTTTPVTGTITNDDIPLITLAVSPASVTEDGATNLVYTFSRTGPTTNALTVNYGITGSADGSDYTGDTPGTGKTITFAAGSATATITIDPTVDTTIEADETVALTLAAGTSYTVGTTTAVAGTITSDHLPVITLAVTPAVVTEDGTANLVYTFTRTGRTTSALNLLVNIGGSAFLSGPFLLTGGDYVLSGDVSGVIDTTATVAFPAGSATATVIANPSADTRVEADVAVVLTLPPGTTYTVGTTTPVTGTIRETLENPSHPRENSRVSAGAD